MKSTIIKRSIQIADRKTSISVEDDFWHCLRKIAQERYQTVPKLVSSIDDDRKTTNLNVNLSSAIRLFVLSVYREQFEARRKTLERSKENINGYHIGNGAAVL